MSRADDSGRAIEVGRREIVSLSARECPSCSTVRRFVKRGSDPWECESCGETLDDDEVLHWSIDGGESTDGGRGA